MGKAVNTAIEAKFQQMNALVAHLQAQVSSLNEREGTVENVLPAAIEKMDNRVTDLVLRFEGGQLEGRPAGRAPTSEPHHAAAYNKILQVENQMT